MDREIGGGRDAGGGQLLEDDRRVEPAEPAAAELVSDIDPGEAERRRPAQRLDRELLAFVPARRVRQPFVAGEVPRAVSANARCSSERSKSMSQKMGLLSAGMAAMGADLTSYAGYRGETIREAARSACGDGDRQPHRNNRRRQRQSERLIDPRVLYRSSPHVRPWCS